MTTYRRLAGALLAGAILFAALPASAQEDAEAPVYAVQNRQYPLGAEFSAALGTLPLNAFVKGLTIGGGFTWHITQTWAWEVAHVAYSFGVDSGLKQQLLQNFMVQPTQIESVQYFGSTSIVLKPFYGKLALVNKYVIHMELFLVAGAAAAHYLPTSFRGGFDAGVGLRFFAGRYFSLRIDVRDYAFFKGSSPTNELYIALGLSLAFGGK